MKILSLFDGMACGMIAMINAGVYVEKYDAYEIDKYAIQTATHNFPMIEEHGDVFQADFTQYFGYDFLVGGESMHILVHRPDQEQGNHRKRYWMGTVQSVRSCAA